MWKIKEKLKDYNSNELKAILMYFYFYFFYILFSFVANVVIFKYYFYRHNNQDFKAGPAELINRIADGELYVFIFITIVYA